MRRLSTAQAKRNKHARLQRLSDKIWLWAIGFGVWVFAWGLAGKAAVATWHQYTSVPQYSDLLIFSIVTGLGTSFGIAILTSIIKDILQESRRLQAELYPTR